MEEWVHSRGLHNTGVARDNSLHDMEVSTQRWEAETQ